MRARIPRISELVQIAYDTGVEFDPSFMLTPREFVCCGIPRGCHGDGERVRVADGGITVLTRGETVAAASLGPRR